VQVLKAHLHRARRTRQRKVVHHLRRKIDHAVIRVYVSKAVLKQVIAKREVVRAKEARAAVHRIRHELRKAKVHKHRASKKHIKHLERKLRSAVVKASIRKARAHIARKEQAKAIIRASKKRVEVRIRRVRHYVREVTVLKHKIHKVKT
jgi:hypothetical protein